MVFTVADHVVVHAHDGGDDAEVGLEAGGEGDDHFLVQELRQLRLELQVHFQRAVEIAGPGAAGAVLLKGVNAGLDDLRIRGQAEIVVGAEHDAALALHDNLDVLTRFQGVTVGIEALLHKISGDRKAVALRKNIHKSTFGFKFRLLLYTFAYKLQQKIKQAPGLVPTRGACSVSPPDPIRILASSDHRGSLSSMSLMT